jgi:hypothetical protein
MKRIYVTHCSAKKNDALRDSGQRASPDRLYMSPRIQTFMSKCKEQGVNWAIFSDKYGIWFPNVEHEWYEKSPDTVTDQEFEDLLNDFDRKLQDYDEIWFYHNPSRFHGLYQRLLQETSLQDKVKLFSHHREIA